MTETSHSSDSAGAAGSPSPGGPFVTTRWSQVIAAGQQDSAQVQPALESLCRTYWGPLYAYVRRRGYSVEDSQDLTQAFFERLLERQWLGAADREKGRFRTFLLTAMERFLSHERERAHALKRGGGQPLVPIQLDEAETRYGVDPQDPRTPEQAFEHRWALALLDQVLGRLEAEFRARGQADHFAALKPCLVGGRADQPYAELAAKLGTGEAAVKVAVHRLRQRYRELLRAEIGETVASPDEVDSEMRHLFQVLTSRV